MIDIHSHILFDTDDGANSLEASLKMAKEAYENGFTQICCTPHYLEPNYISNYEKNINILKILQDRLEQEEINLELKLGNEVFLTENTIKDFENKKILTLNSSKYILLELPMQYELKCLNQIIDQILCRGIKVIIAHPERYKYIQNNIEYVIPFLEKGIIFQGNFGSVEGIYGEKAKQCINKMLKRKFIQILATDSHKPDFIYSKIKNISFNLQEKISIENFEELTTINPLKVINNEKIEFDFLKKKKKFIFF